MGVEIERKFIVKALPQVLNQHQGTLLAQGYLSTDATGHEVRLRKKTDQYYITVKQGYGLERTEVEVALDQRQFEQLWPLTEGKRLTKVRHLVPFNGHTIEVDVYQDELAGLVVAEVEFESKAAAQAFVPPGWFGKEVTEDAQYRNRTLATMGIKGSAHPK